MVCYCSRIVCALFVGSTVGILGIEGLPGFGIYFAQHALCTLPLLLKAGLAPGKYYFHGCACPSISMSTQHFHQCLTASRIFTRNYLITQVPQS
jgi:hypothetical protein